VLRGIKPANEKLRQRQVRGKQARDIGSRLANVDVPPGLSPDIEYYRGESVHKGDVLI
jgi:hypothetical protein